MRNGLTILDEPRRVLNCLACAILSHLTSNDIMRCVTDALEKGDIVVYLCPFHNMNRTGRHVERT